MAEKKKNIKPLIILGVVLVAALIGFLIYDEVKTANYKKRVEPCHPEHLRFGIGQLCGSDLQLSKGKIQKRRAKQYARQILFVQTMA